jgi:AcrR family transcriptional regulator
MTDPLADPALFPQQPGCSSGFDLCGPPAPGGLSDVAQKRRDQIMDAAEAIIAGEGIHKLSLGRIEEKLGGMSRGQLTYYFPNKESILLAVYERMLRRMIVQVWSGDGPKPMTGRAWDCMKHAVAGHLAPDWPPPEAGNLFSLLYTFLAQMGHRPDYRTRLSEMYARWRAVLTADIASSAPGPRAVSPRTAASLFQAVMHGLGMQLMVDPAAFDRAEMQTACEMVFAPLVKGPEEPGAGSSGTPRAGGE